ncbi:MAG TPA: PAS domain S-box protein [bacterium]|nr:PAS domain S-box protein [bacterium]
MDRFSSFIHEKKETLRREWAAALQRQFPGDETAKRTGWMDVLLVLLIHRADRRQDLTDYLHQLINEGELKFFRLSEIIQRINLLRDQMMLLAAANGLAALMTDIVALMDEVVVLLCKSREGYIEKADEPANAIMETTNLLHMELSTSGTLLRCNKAAKKILGDKENFNLAQMIHSEDLKHFVRSLGYVGHGETQIVELRFRSHDDADPVFLLLTMTPGQTVDGRQIVNAVARDVTQARMLQEALRQSEERYRSLIEHANDAILILSLENGRVLEANQQSVMLTGYDNRELIDLDLLDLFPEDKIQAIDLLQRTIHQGGGTFPDLFMSNVKNKLIAVEISTSVVNYENGKVILAILKNVDQRRSLEGELANAQIQINHMREDLSRWRQEYSIIQRDAIIGSFAHEIVDAMGSFLEDLEARIEPLSEGLTGEPLRSLLITQDMAAHWRNVCEAFADVNSILYLERGYAEIDRIVETVTSLLIGTGYRVELDNPLRRIPPIRDEDQVVERIVLGVIYTAASLTRIDEPIYLERDARGNMAMLDIRFVEDEKRYGSESGMFQRLMTSYRALAEELGGGMLPITEEEGNRKVTILLPIMSGQPDRERDFDMIPFPADDDQMDDGDEEFEA